MSSLLRYKGYLGVVEFDADDRVLVGRVIGVNDVIDFVADTAAGVESEFRASVDAYLAFCEKLGREPQRSKSGKFQVRLAPETHRKVEMAAEAKGESMNDWVADVLEHAADNAVVGRIGFAPSREDKELKQG